MEMDASAATAARVLGFLLEQDEPVTRPAVATALGLSRPTVFAAMDHLQSMELVEVVGMDSGRPGRSAALYRVSRAAGLVGAIDIGGSNLRVAVADVHGNILVSRRHATPLGGGAAIVPVVIAMLLEALQEVGPGEHLSAITMSVPGVVDLDGFVVRFASNIDQVAAFDFRTPVERHFGCPVQLDNNVNLAAIGEQWRGAAQGLGTFAVVAVGAGVGAGIVHDGRVVRGAHRAAGEIAYLPLNEAGAPLDPSVHDEGGGIRLMEAARQRGDWADTVPATVEELFQRAEAGEAPAVALFEDECRRIARAVGSVCAVIDPDTVVLTGGVGGNHTFMARVRELVVANVLFTPAIVPSQLGERAALVGATRTAALVRKAALERSLIEAGAGNSLS
ncbi:MAG: ROK family transcriptional regulator [Candidatus Nanopelagicales bacterium]